MHARQTRITGDPSKVDETIEHIRTKVQPALEGADGFKGFSLLVDRETGEFVGTSYFDSREAVEASESAVRAARDQTADVADSEAPQVTFYEVAIDTQA